MVIVVDNKKYTTKTACKPLESCCLKLLLLHNNNNNVYIERNFKALGCSEQKKKKKRKKCLSKNTIIKSLDSCRKRHCLKGKFSV